ncbi:hypothetical protein V1477_000067 [Vespula maculifrons]|uniref:Uncharacterized protein n=1 Tax=Vespula maculifrons TaxID=7453 RepID=A0ABD2D334_VESMC
MREEGDGSIEGEGNFVVETSYVQRTTDTTNVVTAITFNSRSPTVLTKSDGIWYNEKFNSAKMIAIALNTTRLVLKNFADDDDDDDDDDDNDNDNDNDDTLVCTFR